MANFSGHHGFPVPRFLGACDFDHSTRFPLGIGVVAKNSRFNMESVASRWGLKNTVSGAGGQITGLGMLNYIGEQDTDNLLVFDANGNLFKESPAGSGILVPITPWFGSLPANTSAQMVSYANREWMCFGNLNRGIGSPAVYSGLTGNLDPVSCRPFGAVWTSLSSFVVGDCVGPATANGHIYRCTVAGTSGANPPVWTQTAGAIVTDGTVTWQEMTPVAADVVPAPSAPALTRVGGAGTWAASKDVYIKITLKSPQGETDITTTTAATILNTVLNDRITVTSPTLPAWVSALNITYVPTQYRVYVSAVNHGDPAPDDTTYLLSATTTLGTSTNVDTTAGGAAGPTSNTAAIVPAGNLCTGTRYFTVLFRLRSGQIVAADNGYISGYTPVFPCNIEIQGGQVYVANIPTGPQNCVQRIIAWGLADDPAGADSTLAYIPSDLQTGVLETATIIDDNTSTTAFFNFDDSYLLTLMGTVTDVSDFFLKMKVPQCKDIAYLPSLDAMAYVGAIGYESSVLISPQTDPETLYGAGDLASELAVSPQDGERTVCIREVRAGEILVWKDNSVHTVNWNTSVAPSGWNVVAKSRKAGACGPRAVDVCSEFVIAAHRSGVWKYSFQDGSYEKVSDEIRVGWETINWAAAHTIWVCIDETRKVVEIGVPTGNSTVPNKTLTVDYMMGWDFPVHVSLYNKLVPTHTARKWSYFNDIAASCAMVVNRTLSVSLDSRINNRQMLFACPDATVKMLMPDYLNDDGASGNKVAIDWQYSPAYAQSEDLKILRLIGMEAAFTGTGTMSVTPVTENASDLFDYHVYYIQQGRNNKISEQRAGLNNEYWSYLFRNSDDEGNPQVDSAVELHAVTLYADPMWPGRNG